MEVPNGALERLVFTGGVDKDYFRLVRCALLHEASEGPAFARPGRSHDSAVSSKDLLGREREFPCWAERRSPDLKGYRLHKVVEYPLSPLKVCLNESIVRAVDARSVAWEGCGAGCYGEGGGVDRSEQCCGYLEASEPGFYERDLPEEEAGACVNCEKIPHKYRGLEV